MTLFLWSRSGTDNATFDPTVNYREGQAPSSLNDSARNAMAAVAKYRDDNAGAVATTGSGTAYLLSSYQSFDTLAHMHGQRISFTPHVTSAGTCTLNVDSLTAKPLRSAPSVELPNGTLIQGTPYEAVYNNTDGAWYLKGFYGSPIPLASTIEYWAATAPSSAYAFPFGQAISRTTYATLFALIGATYGAGDGSTTFNLPDLRGRGTACPDNMGGGTDPNRLTGGALAGVRNSVGGAGGEAAHTLSASEIPTITTTTNSTFSQSVTSTVSNVVQGSPVTQNLQAGGNPIGAFTNGAPTTGSITSTGTIPRIPATSDNTGGAAHNVMQPTILCNRIMRII